MKFIKGLIIGVFVIILLLAAGVFVVITFYKKDLTELLTDELRDKYNLQLNVGNVKVSFFDNWPHASVQLDDVTVQSLLTAGKSEPLVRAGKISLSFNLERMMHKEFFVRYVTIKDAEITLVKNEDGSRNFIFQKADSGLKPAPAPLTPPTSTAVISFDVKKVSFKDTRFRYINRQRAQNIDLTLLDTDVRMKHYTDGIRGGLTGDVFITELLFQQRKGTFLAKKEAYLDLDLTYFKDEGNLMAMPGSYAEIDKEKYYATTIVHVKEPRKIALIVETPEANFIKAVRLLPAKMQKVLSNFEVNQPIRVKLLLLAKIGKREDPVLIMDFSGNNTSLAIGNSKIPYSGVSFKGRLTSLDSTYSRGEIEKAKVVFSPVKGKIYAFPFSAQVKVVNLIDPKIYIDADLLVEGEKVDFKVAKDFILKGTTRARIRYSGPTEKLNIHEFLEKPMKLSADVSFENMSYREIIRPYVYTVNGKANLNNRDLKFDKLKVNSIVGDAVLKGKAENFVNYILGYSNGFKAHLAARTELLDLNPLFEAQSDSTLRADLATDKENKKKKSKRKKKQKKEEQVPTPQSQTKFEFNVQLFARKMKIRNVEAEFANADMTYKNEFLDIKSLRLNTCEGKLSASGTVEDFNKVSADVSIENVNVTRLFEQFDNFKQNVIVSENLKGLLSLDAMFRTDLDPKLKIIGESMAGEVRLTLRDGHLINFAPVQNLSNVLFRNRNFSDVYFTEINEVFRLQGFKMQINELEIASNVLNLFVVDGLYDFKGVSNINILIPWSNLKRRGKYYVPKSSGQSAESTKGVKLNFQGPGKAMKISFGHKKLGERGDYVQDPE